MASIFNLNMDAIMEKLLNCGSLRSGCQKLIYYRFMKQIKGEKNV